MEEGGGWRGQQKARSYEEMGGRKLGAGGLCEGRDEGKLQTEREVRKRGREMVTA